MPAARTRSQYGGIRGRLPDDVAVLLPRLRVDGVVAEPRAGVGVRVRHALRCRATLTFLSL